MPGQRMDAARRDRKFGEGKEFTVQEQLEHNFKNHIQKSVVWRRAPSVTVWRNCR